MSEVVAFACVGHVECERGTCQTYCGRCPKSGHLSSHKTATASDQPLPTANDLPSCQDMVIADIGARKALGLARYGTLLQPHNGRDMLLDAYQEAIDLAVYLRGCLYERDGK